MTSSNDYAAMIAAIDKPINKLCKFWMAATDAKQKSEWLECINSSLDDPLRLMKLRDAHESKSQN
jgi:hypothetical protein